MTAVVNATFDVSVTIKRVPTPGQDSYGHTTGTPAQVGTALVNIIRPTDTQLQQFAGIIGSQRALMIRYGTATDIRQGDVVNYGGLDWKVQEILIAESYTFANDALITVIT